MQKFRGQLACDAIKLSKTSFFALHLLVPVFGILIFLGYMAMTGHDAMLLSVNYFQVLTLIYPLLAAWLCSIATEQEVEAGGGFYLLGVPSRAKALFSKLLYLLLCGLGACGLVVFGYGFTAGFVRPGFALSPSVMAQMCLVVWGCALFGYLFHTWLGLRFSRNASFAVAAVEILLSSLMVTGLGETIWFFVPSAWGVRLVSLLATYGATGSAALLPSIKLGVSMALPTTALMLLFLFLWFLRWEGRKNEE